MLARILGRFIPQNVPNQAENQQSASVRVDPGGIRPFSPKEFAEISKILEGHEYDLRGSIGFGGFGRVNIAVHIPTGERVAVKILNKRTTYKRGLVEQEISATKSLCHQHICRLLQVIRTVSWTFLVLEYCPGYNLSEYVVRGGRFSEAVARHFFRQLLSAVSYMHQRGIAHRDLKPENLLVSDGYQLKLGDFGFAVRPEGGLEKLLTLPGGTTPFMAPEQIAGKPYKGSQVDIWAMGVVLYELLCAQLPFPGLTIAEMDSNILAGEYVEHKWLSDEAKSVLKGMLERDPTLRITIEELLSHPWVNLNYTSPIKWRSVFEPPIIDDDCLMQLAKHRGESVATVKTEIFKYESETALYSLLVRRKLQNLSITLKSPAEMKELKVTPLVIDAGILANLIELEMQLERNKPVKEDFVFATPIKIRKRRRLPQPTDNLSSGNWDRPGTSKTPFGAQPSAQSIGIPIDNYFACEKELDMEIDPGEVNFQVEQMAPIEHFLPVNVAAVAAVDENVEAPQRFVCRRHKSRYCGRSFKYEKGLLSHKRRDHDGRKH